MAETFTNNTTPAPEGPGVVFYCKAPYIEGSVAPEHLGESDPGAVVPASIQNAKLPNSPQPDYVGPL